MSLYSRVIKSESVKIVDAGQKTAERFEPLRCGNGSAAQPQLNDPCRKPPVEADIETVKKLAYDEGFSEGEKKGRSLQKTAMLKTAETMTQLISQMASVKQQALDQAETQMLHLTLAIAKKIIHREAAVESEVVLNVIRQAIRHVADRDGMKIRINPRDFRQIMEIKEDFLQGFDGVKNVVFEEDAGIQQGGAVIETLFGEVDARLDRQIEELAASLLA